MVVPSLSDRIQERLGLAGATVTGQEVAQLAAYVELLARWNRKINLTSFQLDAPSAEAIDRLIVEPVLAGRQVGLHDQTLLDLGSGGGSPAIPLKIVRSGLKLTMVESRTRKAAFLREVARSVALTDTRVENLRFEQLVHQQAVLRSMDVISFRAVRADGELWRVVEACLAPAGRVFWFGAPGGIELPARFDEAARVDLDAGGTTTLLIAARAR